jgi:hypothetical protein
LSFFTMFVILSNRNSFSVSMDLSLRNQNLLLATLLLILKLLHGCCTLSFKWIPFSLISATLLTLLRVHGSFVDLMILDYVLVT